MIDNVFKVRIARIKGMTRLPSGRVIRKFVVENGEIFMADFSPSIGVRNFGKPGEQWEYSLQRVRDAA